MASILKHLRSSTADKRPTASGLADGQIALNTASGTPAMFFKDSAGNIVKVGPAHIGTTAPNVSPAGSAGNSDGELWIDESLTTRGLKYYDGTAFINLTPSGTTSTVGLVELATDAETQTGTDNVRVVTPSGLQSKISDSTSTTSSTTIASSTAVKSAFDLANAALPKTGGTLTGELLISPSGSLVFEGSSDDSFETTIAVTNPTADRTITFPNVTGNVVTTGDSGTVTSTMILDDTIVNADINSAAAIAHSKLANITAGSVLLGNASNVPTATALSGDVTINSSGVTTISAGVIVNADINASAAIVDTKLDTIATADKVSLSALNIDGATDIGGALENGDLFIVDDGAGGTNRKAQAFRMAQLTYSGVTGDITVASGGTAAISAGVIVNADVNASAAIAGTKISPDFGSQTITTTGVVSAALGAAATPSLTFTGDLNTGIYSPGADQVAISTGGSGRLFVDSSGRLGVGTASPATTLAVNGNITLADTGTGASYITSVKAGNSFYIGVDNSTGSTFGSGTAYSPIIYTGANAPITFSNNSTERVRIDSSGNMAVGTSSPLTNGYPAFTVSNSTQANLYFEDTGYEATGDGVGYFSWDNGALSFTTASRSGTGTTGSTERLKIDSSGRVGIGTSTPGYPLHVAGRISYIGAISEGADITLSSSATTVIVGESANWQNLSLRTNGNTRLHINSSGNVGIGTTSPAATLHSRADNAGSGSTPLLIQNRSTSANTAVGISFAPNTSDTADRSAIIYGVNSSGGSGNATDLTFHTNANGGSPSEKARLDSSGRWLLGTSTSRGNTLGTPKLQIEGAGDNFDSSLGITSNSANGYGPSLVFGISKGTSNGSVAALTAAATSLGRIDFTGADGTSLLPGCRIEAFTDSTPGANDMPGRLVFSTTADGASSPTERMRINSVGNVLCNTTSAGSAGGVNGQHTFSHSISSQWSTIVQHTVAAGNVAFGLAVKYTAATPNNTSSEFLYCEDATAIRAAIRSNGGLANYSANNANLSDRNAKKDISPAAGTWDCIKEWEIVNYRYKDQPDNADLNLGVIAQQVAESCPEVITIFEEAKDDQPEKLGVKEQQMYWMAIKALQEAQVRIEALEAEVAALKAQ